jgi:hypothetical protein
VSKLIVLASTLPFLFLAATTQRDRFSKYKAVETYEVRPGILMMPRYTADGQICEIGLERRHYSPEMIRLDAEIPGETIDQVIDELVPASERGERSKDLLGGYLIDESGPGMTLTSSYQNVSIYRFSRVLSRSRRGETIEANVAASITWKNRKCE